VKLLSGGFMDLKTFALIAGIVYSIACEIINFNPAWKSNSVLEVILKVLGILKDV
jgi:hypothetical protein